MPVPGGHPRLRARAGHRLRTVNLHQSSGPQAFINQAVDIIGNQAGPIHRVRVPVLFTSRIDSQPDGAQLAGGLAYASNFANLASQAGRICLSECDSVVLSNGSRPFRAAVQTELAGAPLTFIPAWLHHMNQGSVHCATNSVRALPQEDPWWQILATAGD